MALGAERQDLLRMVLGEGAKMAVIGGLVGLALAVPLPKIFRSMFFDLQVGEPRIYLVVALAIMVVAIAAAYIPVRRAARVEPTKALRQD